MRLIRAIVAAALLLPAVATADITYVAKGSDTWCSPTSGPCSLTAPAGIQNNDILVLFAVCGTNCSSISIPASYTTLRDETMIDGGTTWVRVKIAWKRTTGSESSATVSQSGASDIMGVITAWRGCVTSGNPFDQSNASSGYGSSISTTGVVTTVANDMILHFAGFDYYGATCSGWGGTATTERTDNTSSLLCGASGLKVTAGSTGSQTTTLSSAQHWVGVVAALKPPSAPPGTPGTPTYSSIGATSVNVSWTAATGADSYKVERAPDSSGSPGTYAEVAAGVSSPYTNNTGLTAGNKYWYRVRGTNASGDGPYSSGSSVLLLPPAPGTPTFSFTVNTATRVSWTSANGAASYKLERAVKSGTCGTFSSVQTGITSTFYDDTGLSANTTYCYRVRGTNSSGDGAFSGTGEVTTTNNLPQTPGNVTYTNVGATSVTLNWTQGTFSDSYKIERAPDSGGSPGAWTEIYTGVVALTKNDTGLTTNTTYWYRVRGFNTVGNGPYSTATSVTTVSAPGAPGNPTFVNVGGTTLTVQWTAATGATSYKVERAPDSSGSPGTFAQIASGTTNTYYNDSGLTVNTIYWYRVRGSNAAGDGSYSGNSSVLTDSSVFATNFQRYGCWAPDGNCFAVMSNGARIDFGAGTSDYATSDGTTVTFAGPVTSPGMWSGVVFQAADQTIGTTATDITGMSFPVTGAGTYVVRVTLLTKSGDGATYGANGQIKSSGFPTTSALGWETSYDADAGAMQGVRGTATATDFIGSNLDTPYTFNRAVTNIRFVATSSGTFQLRGRRTGGTADPVFLSGSTIEWKRL